MSLQPSQPSRITSLRDLAREGLIAGTTGALQSARGNQDAARDTYSDFLGRIGREGSSVQPGGTMPGGGSGHGAVNPPGSTQYVPPPAGQAPGAPTAATAPDARPAPYARPAPNARMAPDAGAATATHLDSLLAKDSPLMQRARTEGMQFGNSRGLLNSTLTAGAAQGAMIDRALPIAQQDAAHQQSLQRDQYQSDLGLQETGYRSDLELQQTGYRAGLDLQRAGFDQQNQLDQMGYGADIDLQKLRESAGLDLRNASWMKNMDTEAQSRLMEEESGWAQIIKGNEQASEAWRWAMNAITLIEEGEGTPEQKAAGTRYITASLKAQRTYLERIYGVPARQPVYPSPSASSIPADGFDRTPAPEPAPSTSSGPSTPHPRMRTADFPG